MPSPTLLKQLVCKDSLYRIVFIGKTSESYIYNNKTGSAYHFSVSNDSIDCEDYKVQNDTFLRWKIIDTVEQILGKEVKILEFVSKYSTNRFYFSLEITYRTIHCSSPIKGSSFIKLFWV